MRPHGLTRYEHGDTDAAGCRDNGRRIDIEHERTRLDALLAEESQVTGDCALRLAQQLANFAGALRVAPEAKLLVILAEQAFARVILKP